MKPVEIIWTDALGGDGWVEKEEVEKLPLAQIHSVGLLVNETPDHITITLADDPAQKNCGAYMVIPKFAIKKKRFLK